MNAWERGDSLIEVVVAVAIMAIVVAAVSSATLAAVHRFGPDPIQTALQAQATREMRLAVDIMKYQGATLAPRSIATTVPLPGGSPIPAHVSLGVGSLQAGGVTVTITASSDTDTTKSATVQTTIAQPAPLPNSSVTNGQTVAAPIGSQ